MQSSIRIKTLASVFATFSITSLSASAVEDNTQFNLDSKIAATVPTKDEDRWLTIPWRTNLMKARLEAQILNRPLFLWIMNGNPMGCT
ncbi:MAG: hypothetical protein HYX67_09315 [Candidatus Melainabacteria bacterium]|nr:hypothetical protein [Candidatus Melainabacteria bacterium]